MSWWRRIRVRLFASYAVVALAGALVLLVTIRVAVPALFDERLRGMGTRAGSRGGNPAMHDALVTALNRSLLLALLVSLVVAAVIAFAVAGRILRPVDHVRAATRRLAAGHYDERVPLPSEPELAALAADVNELGRCLADTERRRSQLVSDVAHELRTPLTAIRGYAEGMSDGVIAPDAEVLATILAEVSRLERLASDLSTLSRVDEGTFSFEFAPVAVAAVASDVVARLRPVAEHKDITVGLNIDDATDVVVDGDRERLGQAVANLIANGVTYTPPAGRVTVVVSSDQQSAYVTVTDTGVGLEGDDKERVFDRFYRVEGVDRPPGGSGIGLAITRAIVRAHGGDVTATSAGRDLGSTFTIRLPRSQHVINA